MTEVSLNLAIPSFSLVLQNFLVFSITEGLYSPVNFYENSEKYQEKCYLKKVFL